MRFVDGRYECTVCGTALDVPLDSVAKINVTAASGEPTMRNIAVGGQIVHSCQLARARP